MGYGGQLALILVGPQRFAHAPPIMAHHRGGEIEDRAGRAVVLFQAHHLGAGEPLGEGEKAIHVGAPKAIDRLVVVAHHAQVAARPVQDAQQLELGLVGVLELVDQDYAKPFLHRLAHLGVAAQQGRRQQDEVAEVDAVEVGEATLVAGVQARHRKRRAAHRGQVAVRSDAAVLGRGDPRRHVADVAGEVLVGVVGRHLRQDLAHVAVVEDRQPGRVETEAFAMHAQQPRPERVEGAHHDPVARIAAPVLGDQPPHPRAHLVRRLVGKRDRQDVGSRHRAGGDQVGHLGGDDARLSRAGPGQDQERRAAVQYRLALALVQSRQAAIRHGC